MPKKSKKRGKKQSKPPAATAGETRSCSPAATQAATREMSAARKKEHLAETRKNELKQLQDSLSAFFKPTSSRRTRGALAPQQSSNLHNESSTDSDSFDDDRGRADSPLPGPSTSTKAKSSVANKRKPSKQQQPKPKNARGAKSKELTVDLPVKCDRGNIPPNGAWVECPDKIRRKYYKGYFFEKKPRVNPFYDPENLVAYFKKMERINRRNPDFKPYTFPPETGDVSVDNVPLRHPRHFRSSIEFTNYVYSNPTFLAKFRYKFHRDLLVEYIQFRIEFCEFLDVLSQVEAISVHTDFADLELPNFKTMPDVEQENIPMPSTSSNSPMNPRAPRLRKEMLTESESDSDAEEEKTNGFDETMLEVRYRLDDLDLRPDLKVPVEWKNMLADLMLHDDVPSTSKNVNKNTNNARTNDNCKAKSTSQNRFASYTLDKRAIAAGVASRRLVRRSCRTLLLRNRNKHAIRKYLHINQSVVTSVPPSPSTVGECEYVDLLTRFSTPHVPVFKEVFCAIEPDCTKSAYNPLPACLITNGYRMHTLYSTKFPDDKMCYTTLAFMCESCMAPFYRPKAYVEHKKFGCIRFSGGKEVYRDPALDLVVIEVDPEVLPIIANRVITWAKSFVQKIGIEGSEASQMFYILMKYDTREKIYNYIGAFTRPKKPMHHVNLSFITVLPCYRLQGYGRFMVALSFLFSKKEHIPGMPMRPLNYAADQLYCKFYLDSYYEAAFAFWTNIGGTPFAADTKQKLSIDYLESTTGICAKEMLLVLKQRDLIRIDSHSIEFIVNRASITEHMLALKDKKTRIVPHEKLLKWEPFMKPPTITSRLIQPLVKRGRKLATKVQFDPKPFDDNSLVEPPSPPPKASSKRRRSSASTRRRPEKKVEVAVPPPKKPVRAKPGPKPKAAKTVPPKPSARGRGRPALHRVPPIEFTDSSSDNNSDEDSPTPPPVLEKAVRGRKRKGRVNLKPPVILPEEPVVMDTTEEAATEGEAAPPPLEPIEADETQPLSPRITESRASRNRRHSSDDEEVQHVRVRIRGSSLELSSSDEDDDTNDATRRNSRKRASQADENPANDATGGATSPKRASHHPSLSPLPQAQESNGPVSPRDVNMDFNDDHASPYALDPYGDEMMASVEAMPTERLNEMPKLAAAPVLQCAVDESTQSGALDDDNDSPPPLTPQGGGENDQHGSTGVPSPQGFPPTLDHAASGPPILTDNSAPMEASMSEPEPRLHSQPSLNLGMPSTGVPVSMEDVHMNTVTTPIGPPASAPTQSMPQLQQQQHSQHSLQQQHSQQSLWPIPDAQVSPMMNMHPPPYSNQMDFVMNPTPPSNANAGPSSLTSQQQMSMPTPMEEQQQHPIMPSLIQQQPAPQVAPPAPAKKPSKPKKKKEASQSTAASQMPGPSTLSQQQYGFTPNPMGYDPAAMNLNFFNQYYCPQTNQYRYPTNQQPWGTSNQSVPNPYPQAGYPSLLPTMQGLPYQSMPNYQMMASMTGNPVNFGMTPQHAAAAAYGAPRPPMGLPAQAAAAQNPYSYGYDYGNNYNGWSMPDADQQARGVNNALFGTNNLNDKKAIPDYGRR